VGENARALWMHYDTDFGLGHAHRDAFNIGLFGHGADLMPDLGYPPVQYGGWETEKVRWYRSTAAHNTVVLNDADHVHVAETEFSFLESSQYMLGMRARCKAFGEFTRYQRTVAMIRIDEVDFYVVDVFHVVGGTSHTKFFHSNLGAMIAEELNRSFTWSLADGVCLRYTDLTEGAIASTCDAWISTGGFNEMKEALLPRLRVRREGEVGLESTFISIVEPYRKGRRIWSIVRNGERIDIGLTSGERDSITFTDDAIHHVRLDAR
jgi:oligo-alginate lyase